MDQSGPGEDELDLNEGGVEWMVSSIDFPSSFGVLDISNSYVQSAGPASGLRRFFVVSGAAILQNSKSWLL